MQITLTTPALLFPAISLLLLAYTNRFLAIATLIRQLHKSYLNDPKSVLEGQLKNLRKRLFLIRAMQMFGVVSLLLCVLAMFFIYLKVGEWGSVIFGISLVLLLLSLIISVREIQLSTKALDLELSDMELGSKLKF
jgi:energy-converting hydrogenase Eha subunit C